MGRSSADPSPTVVPAGLPGCETRDVRLGDGLRVRTVACAPAPGKPPAMPTLFVHCYGGSLALFGASLRPVADAGVPVHAFDLKGHGFSDKPEAPDAYTLEAFGRHVVDVLDALGLERAMLVGHSMGGGIAAQAAAWAPERVAALVLLAPIGFGRVPLIGFARWLLPPALDPVASGLVNAWSVQLALALARGTPRRSPSALVETILAPKRRDPRLGPTLLDVARTVDWRPGAVDLGRVQCPTLVMFGTRDRIVRPVEAESFVGRMRGAWLERLAGAGHLLPIEQAGLVNDAVVAWARGAATDPDALRRPPDTPVTGSWRDRLPFDER